MKDNVYLIIHEDYTYSVCFSPIHPIENAIFLTAEKDYPVVYCYVESKGTESSKMVVCHDREELAFELNRSGKYYKLIQLLWDYNWKSSKNPLMGAWEDARDRYLWEHDYEYMSTTSYCEIDKHPEILSYWFASRPPYVAPSEKVIEWLMEEFQNRLCLGADGILYEEQEGEIFSLDLECLVKYMQVASESSISSAQKKLESSYAVKDWADDIIHMLHRQPGLLPSIKRMMKNGDNEHAVDDNEIIPF